MILAGGTLFSKNPFKRGKADYTLKPCLRLFFFIFALSLFMLSLTFPTLLGTKVCSYNIQSIAMGDYHTCIILNDKNKTLKCWGDNLYGHLGLGDKGEGAKRVTPTTVDVGGPVRVIGTGYRHTCAILDDKDKTLKCWGYNDYGQLGLGNKGRGTERVTPTTVKVGGPVQAMSLGYWHTCIILNDKNKTLKCWGDNLYGHLGLGYSGRGRGRTTPTTVDVGGPVRVVVAGNNHTCAVLDDKNKTLKCWGDNIFGQLGIGDGKERTRPTTVKIGGPVRMIGARGSYTCAVLDDRDKTLKCWGSNHVGQLGLGDKKGRGTPTTVKVGGPVQAMALGSYHICVILDDKDKTLKCWGYNQYEQLGLGKEWSHIRDVTTPVKVKVGNPVRMVGVGYEHTCAVLDDRNKTLKCWGYNEFGQLGLGHKEKRLLPTTVNSVEICRLKK